MTKGYVYVLTNPSMPGIVKIGKTTRTVQQRAEELWQTGVPTPFVIYGSVLAPNCHELESYAHSCFADRRVSFDREFFAVGPAEALSLAMYGARAQVSDLVREFLPYYSVIPQGLTVDQGMIYDLANGLNEEPETICDALCLVSNQEMQRLLARLEWVKRIEVEESQDAPDNVVQIHG